MSNAVGTVTANTQKLREDLNLSVWLGSHVEGDGKLNDEAGKQAEDSVGLLTPQNRELLTEKSGAPGLWHLSGLDFARSLERG